MCIRDRNKDVADLGQYTAVLDFIPIVGDVKGMYEVAQLMKENPVNWALVGALAGATVIGMVPGVGDAAAAAIKAGAKKGLKGVKGGKEMAKKLSVPVDAPPPKLSGFTDEEIRTMIPNLAERSIAAGQKNIFEGSVVRPEMVKKAKQDLTDTGWNFRGEPDDAFQKRQDKLDADAKANEGMTDGEINRRELGLDEADVIAGDFSSMYDVFKQLPGKDNQGPAEFKEWLIENDVPFLETDFEAWTLKKSHIDHGGKDPIAFSNEGGIIGGCKGKRGVKKKRGVIG